MAIIETARFLLKKYTSGGDPHPTRDEHNLMIDAVENNAVMGAQGITSARPAAGKGRRFFWDETVKRAYYDDGANWNDLNPNGGGGAGSTITPGATAAEGVSNRAARADHTHALPLATGAAHGGMSSGDKTKLDAATAAATPSTLASRDGSGRISTGTPTDAAHAATKAYVDGLIVDTGDYVDAQLLKTKHKGYQRNGSYVEPAAAGGAINTINIPDPGYPYLVSAHAIVEANGGASGARWDITLRIGGTTVSAARGDVVAPWFTVAGNNSAPITGATTVTLYGQRVAGTGNLGLTGFNQFFTAMVHPA